MRHNLCGLEYLTAPAHFTSTGRRCPVCSRFRIAGKEEKQQEYFRRIQVLHAERERNILSTDSGRPGCPDVQWEQKQEEPGAFQAQHGHSEIPYGYITGGYNPGS